MQNAKCFHSALMAQISGVFRKENFTNVKKGPDENLI